MKLIGRSVGVVLIALLASAATHAQSVDRGPYLQLQTDDGITIHWRTDIATDSVVRFGASPDSLTNSAVAGGSTTDHIVTLTGLGAAQQYYYSVGDSIGPLAGDATYHFHTAPPRGVPADTRIWVIGDSGTGNSDARNVRDAFKAWTASHAADFWLMLGDNAYNDGTQSEYQTAVFETDPEILRQLPLWATLGNHDGHSADSATQSGPYYDIFDLPAAAEAGGKASGTEAYYSFDYANIHFICLDSYDSDRSAGGSMLLWLQSDLALNTQPWVVAFWHHPPYTKGSHNSDSEAQLIDMRQNALPILEAWGVDLVLTGHSHTYERSYLLDGHYGSSGTLDPGINILDPGDGRVTGDGAYEKPDVVAADHAGAVYAVAGSSGKVSTGYPLNHPAMYVGLESLGSLLIDVSGNRMDVVFIDQTGVARDNFAVIKTPDFDPLLISNAAAEDGNHVVVEFNEPLDSIEAENPANFAIAGLLISQAELINGYRAVRLTTSSMTNGSSYTLEVSNVEDLFNNTILPGSTVEFDYTAIVTQTFQQGVLPAPGYDGARDAYIRQASPGTAYGLDTTLQVDGDEPAGSGNDMNILLYWDISAIPGNAIVESAHIELEVTNVSNGVYACYSLLAGWQEDQVTWNQAASGTPWGSPGAASGGDRGSQQLCTVSAGSLGPLTVNLTPAGLALVQSWVNSASSNHGLIISDPATTDGADFHSRESATTTARPKLEITYSVPVTPGNADPVAGFGFSCTDLDCSFTDTSSDSDGTITAWDWDFGDGNSSTVQNPSHTYAAGADYPISLTVTDNDGATSFTSTLIHVSAPPVVIDQFAQADLPSAGTVSGSYTQTASDDAVSQSITERESGGKKNARYSYLSHTWQFSVAPGSAITLYANAWSGGSSDGDTFVFAWSSNNSDFNDLFTVTSTDVNNLQSAMIPAGGTVYIRVRDTDQTTGHNALDTVFVDQLFIRTDSATPPNPPAAPENLQVTSVSSSSIALAWSHPSEDETGFDLERSPDGPLVWTQIASPGGGSSEYTDTGLDPSTVYLYRIRARNNAGVSAWTDPPTSGTTSAPPGISLSASGYKNRGVHIVDLSWSGAAGATVDVMRDGALLTGTPNDGAFTDNTGNKGGRTYYYSVCETGGGPCSNEIIVVF